MSATQAKKQEYQALNRYAAAKHGTRQAVEALGELNRALLAAISEGLAPVISPATIGDWVTREVLGDHLSLLGMHR